MPEATVGAPARRGCGGTSAMSVEATSRHRSTTADHLTRLRVEGERFAEVAEAAAELDRPVPACPGWDLDALIRHLGDVHRWAAAIVRERLQERLRRDHAGPRDREGLLAWFRDGHAELLDALTASSPEEAYWTWAPAPNPQAFWARRQAHETAIHRLDAEQAAGIVPVPFPAESAADGVAEWLTIAVKRCRVPEGDGRLLHLAATDTGDDWVVALGPDRLRLAAADAADCTVRASAGDLFALTLNRRDGAGLEVAGDAGLLRAWRDSVRF